eukprot:gene1743-2350_t
MGEPRLLRVAQPVTAFDTDELHQLDRPLVPPTVLLNPVITPLGDAEEEDWEGCLIGVDLPKELHSRSILAKKKTSSTIFANASWLQDGSRVKALTY